MDARNFDFGEDPQEVKSSAETADEMIKALEEAVNGTSPQEQGPPWLPQLLGILGRIGGTIHQALEEVKNLKDLKDRLKVKEYTIRWVVGSVNPVEAGDKRKEALNELFRMLPVTVTGGLDVFTGMYHFTAKIKAVDLENGIDNGS